MYPMRLISVPLHRTQNGRGSPPTLARANARRRGRWALVPAGGCAAVAAGRTSSGARWSMVVTVAMLSGGSDIGLGQRTGRHSRFGLTTGAEQRLESVSGASGRAIRIDHRADVYRT